MIIIGPAELTENKDESIVQTTVEVEGDRKRLWYSVERQYGQYLTHEKLDGFLVGVLPLAMELGEDVTVRGSISEKLYSNLQELMEIYHIAVPAFSPINIVPDSLDDGKNFRCEQKIGTAYTGGIDSFFTIYKYYVKEDIPPQEKITHLVFGNVGGHYRLWNSVNSRDIFNSRYEIIKGFAKDYKIDFIKVDSNLSEVVKKDIGFNFYYPLSYLSVPLILQKLFSKYYYSSGVQKKDPSFRDVQDIASTDFVTVRLLSTETMKIVLTGTDFNRVEKTKQILENGLAKHRLNVCIHPHKDGTNCSKCKKCCRTLLTIELLGYLNDYKDVFDLKKWARRRNSYIINSVLKSNADITRDHLADDLAKEVREYAESVNYKFTFYQKSMARIMSEVAQILNKIPRRTYRRLRKYYIKLVLRS